MKRIFILCVLVLMLVSAFPASTLAQGQPVVRAVLYYSPTCPHCHKVIAEDLPPLLEKYQDQLEVIPVDVTTEGGGVLYQAYLNYFEVPEERYGVPALVVGNVYMVGSVEIPEMFPGIIEEGLAQGGIDWPQIPELISVLIASGIIEGDDAQSAPAQPEPEEVAPVPTSSEFGEEGAVEDTGSREGEAGGIGTGIENIQSPESMTVAQRFGQDIVGNSLSVLVLLALAFSAVLVSRQVMQSKGTINLWPMWVIPVLVLAGLALSAYMSYIEISDAEAVCGPVGNCDLVHSSKYAFLFGVFPVGVFGFIGYLALGWAWLVNNFSPGVVHKYSALVLFGMALFGVLFSAYLTFLEPFVIGATCMWCLASALVMILILWAAKPMAIEAMAQEPQESDSAELDEGQVESVEEAESNQDSKE